MAEEETNVINLFKNKLEEAIKLVPNLTSMHPTGMQMWLNALQTGNDVQFKLSTTEDGSIQIILLQPDQETQPSTSKSHVFLPSANSLERTDISEESNSNSSSKDSFEEWGLFHKEGNIVAQPIKETVKTGDNQFYLHDDLDNSMDVKPEIKSEISLLLDTPFPEVGNPSTGATNEVNDRMVKSEISIADIHSVEVKEEAKILVSIATDSWESLPEPTPVETSVKGTSTDDLKTTPEPAGEPPVGGPPVEPEAPRFPCVRPQWYHRPPRRPREQLVDDHCDVDTAVVASDMRTFLRSNTISLGNFAKNYLQRTQGTLSDLLNHPKPWRGLSARGRSMYTRMMEFLNAEDLNAIVAHMKEMSARPGPPIVTLPMELMDTLRGCDMPASDYIEVVASNLQLPTEQLVEYCTSQRDLYMKHLSDESAPLISDSETFSERKRSDKQICPQIGCGVILSSKVALKNHLMSHTGARPHACPRCDKKFATFSNMKTHERRHGKPPKTSKRAVTAAALHRKDSPAADTDTLNSIETTSPASTKLKPTTSKFMCGLCSQRFGSRSLLNQHITCQHSSVKLRDRNGEFVCHVCAKSYRTVASLVVHLRSHTGDRPFSCRHCSKSFCTKANLLRHERTHSGLKPHKCPKCPSRFTEHSSVVTHLRTHTGERPYQCEVCKKRFTQSGPLEAHRALHSSRRPFLCDICGMSFRQKSNLRAHEMRHRGVRKHVCRVCDHSFQYRTDLFRHMSKHNGERPYACKVCEQTFTRLQYLKEHAHKVHDISGHRCEHCGSTWSSHAALERHRATCQDSLLSSGGVANKQALLDGDKLTTLSDAGDAEMTFGPSMLQVVSVDKIIGEGVLNDGKTYLLSVPPDSDEHPLSQSMCCITPLSPHHDPAVSAISSALRSDTDPSLSVTDHVTSQFHAAMTSSSSDPPMHVAIMTDRGVLFANADTLEPALLETTGGGEDPRLKLGLPGHSGADAAGPQCSVDPNLQSVIVSQEDDGARYVVVSVSDSISAAAPPFGADPAVT